LVIEISLNVVIRDGWSYQHVFKVKSKLLHEKEGSEQSYRVAATSSVSENGFQSLNVYINGSEDFVRFWDE